MARNHHPMAGSAGTDTGVGTTGSGGGVPSKRSFDPANLKFKMVKTHHPTANGDLTSTDAGSLEGRSNCPPMESRLGRLEHSLAEMRQSTDEIRRSIQELINLKKQPQNHLYRNLEGEIPPKIPIPLAFQVTSKPTVVVFPWFNGAGVHDWISQANIYFQNMGTPNRHKVEVASQHLFGDALRWYEWHLYDVGTWTDLVRGMITRFSPKRTGDSRVDLSNLKQDHSCLVGFARITALPSIMDTEDADVLPGSSNSGGEHGSGNEEILESNSGPSVVESQPIDNDVEGGNMNKELGINEGDVGTAACTIDGNNLLLSKGDVGVEEGATCTEVLGLQAIDTVAGESANQVNSVLSKSDDGTEEGELPMDTEVDMDLVDSPVREVHVEVAESVPFRESQKSFSSRVNGEIGFLDGQNDGIIPENKSSGRNISGVKRARRTYDEEHATVHVAYNFLTSASKRKLEELLQKWSEWHSQHGYSTQDADEVLESGEETYFPALRVGMDSKASAVSFRIENRTWKRLNDGDTPLDAKSVPLYDREYALGLTSTDGSTNVEGGLEIMDAAARCFNCGGYNHSLKECPKPRNNAAVNNARKQHKSKRNQTSGSRIPTRYYQKSSGGKYGDLKPGSLAAETRQVLGLGDLDPPPWLNRMRELGYPPGYLDPDEDEDQPSGITIFADKDTKNEKEDGEIVETDDREPRRRMSVEFPGINAPIQKDADERRWEVGPSSFDSFLNQSHRRLNHSSEPTSRWHHHERRPSRGFIDDGPPGVDLVFSPPSSSYPPRYGNYEPSYSSETHTFSRSHSERGRRSSLAYEDYSSHGSPSYPPLDRRSSPQDIGLARSAYESDERWDNYSLDHSFRSNDSHDHRRQRRR